MSAHFLCQESIPSDYLRQATCGTLGIMLKFDAAHDFCRKMQNASILYEAAFTIKLQNTMSPGKRFHRLRCAVETPASPAGRNRGTLLPTHVTQQVPAASRFTPSGL